MPQAKLAAKALDRPTLASFVSCFAAAPKLSFVEEERVHPITPSKCLRRVGFDGSGVLDAGVHRNDSLHRHSVGCRLADLSSSLRRVRRRRLSLREDIKSNCMIDRRCSQRACDWIDQHDAGFREEIDCRIAIKLRNPAHSAQAKVVMKPESQSKRGNPSAGRVKTCLGARSDQRRDAVGVRHPGWSRVVVALVPAPTAPATPELRAGLVVDWSVDPRRTGVLSQLSIEPARTSAP